MKFLDDLPVATLAFLASVVVIVIAYIDKDLTVFQALEAVGAAGVGSGVVGVARNGAGRGMRKTPQ